MCHQYVSSSRRLFGREFVPRLRYGMTMFRFINILARLLLRSPFHGVLSGNTLIIGFTGVHSGKRYAVPVSYIQDGATIRCFTAGKWWRNLGGGAPVSLRLRGREVEGAADVVTSDKAAIAGGLSELLHRVPRDLRFYGVELDANGMPSAEDVQRLAQRTVMITITLSNVH